MSLAWLLWVLLARAQDPLEETESMQAADPRAALENARLQERSVLTELDEIDRALSGVRVEMADIETRHRDGDQLRKQHEDEVTSAEAILAQRKGRIATRLGALYRLHRRGLARIVFGAEDPAELRRLSTYLLFIVRADLANLEEFANIANRKRTALAALDAQTAAVTALHDELLARKAELEGQRVRRVALMEELRTRKALAMRALSEYAATGRNLDRQLDMTGSASLTPSGSSSSFREAYGRLPWPTTGRLRRGFGPYVDPLSGARNDNLGIDIEASFGTPFRAVHQGQVRLADFIPGYGQTVAVEHGPYTTVYAHANGLVVRRGQSVSAGDVLGYVGDTGLTDGASYQLTFELRYNGTPQDPLPWLTGR